MNILRFSYSNTTPTTPGFWVDEVTYTLENPMVTVCDGDDYRFGLKVLTEESVFISIEKDNEVKGVGNSLEFKFRIYDSRLGRWLSLDQLQAKYPSLSPYNFVANSPIFFIDPNGKQIEIGYYKLVNNKIALIEIVIFKDGKLYNVNGTIYEGNNEYLLGVQSDLNELKK